MKIVIIGEPKEGKTTMAYVIERALAKIDIKVEIQEEFPESTTSDIARMKKYEPEKFFANIKQPVIIETQNVLRKIEESVVYEVVCTGCNLEGMSDDCKYGRCPSCGERVKRKEKKDVSKG